MKRLILFLLGFNIFMGSLTLYRQGSFTQSFFSDSESIAVSLTAATSFAPDLEDLEGTVQEVANAVAGTSSNPGELYDYMTSDFKDSFSRDEFNTALANSGLVVETVSFPTEVQVFGNDGEWGEALIEVGFSNGQTRTYRVFFRAEGYRWRLFGTQLVPN